MYVLLYISFYLLINQSFLYDNIAIIISTTLANTKIIGILAQNKNSKFALAPRDIKILILAALIKKWLIKKATIVYRINHPMLITAPIGLA